MHETAYFNTLFSKWQTKFLNLELYLLLVSVMFLLQQKTDSELKLIVQKENNYELLLLIKDKYSFHIIRFYLQSIYR